MGDRTQIEWTDATWSPVTGCTKVSAGCRFCYAERVSKRMGQEFSKVILHPERLKIPYGWRRPRKVFVCSMADLFHERVPISFLDDVLCAISNNERHIFQVLTKRAERMYEIMTGICGQGRFPVWPIPNLHLGTSAENQEQADKRTPFLLQTPAAVRFVSLEPLLGPIDLSPWLPFSAEGAASQMKMPGLDWVIVGGESGGPPERALVWQHKPPVTTVRRNPVGHGPWQPKPEALEWVRAIIRQCKDAGVPVLMKQWGGPTPKSGGRLVDGKLYHEFPQVPYGSQASPNR